jgi:hypothetical protein
MKFEPADIRNGGNIRCSLQFWERSKSPFFSIIHVAFAGDYRDGASGAPDAYYIAGLMEIAKNAWGASALIVDLRELRYDWGDDMALVLEPPTEVAAILVGPKCERAISTLCYGIDTTRTVVEKPNVFDDFGPAVEYVTRELVADWNSSVAQDSMPNRRKLLNVDDVLNED